MNLTRWFKQDSAPPPSVALMDDAGEQRHALLVINVDSSGATGTEVNVPDGQDVTQGAVADAAVVTDAAGTVNAHARGIVALLAGILRVGGDAAHASADSGNPVKIGGRYNTSPPVLTNGQRGNAQLDASANLKITDPTVSKNAGVVDATTIRVVNASDGPTVAVLGATTDAGVSTDANGSINAHIRGLILLLLSALKVGGDVASGATDSGLPVKTGGKYNLVPITLTDGQRGDSQLDANGYLRTDEQYQPTAEDNPNAVFAVLMKPVVSATYSPSSYKDAGTVTAANVKGSAGNVLAVRATNANAGVRWLQLHNKATIPLAGETPQLYYLMPAGSALQPATLELDTTWFAPSEYFATGIGWAISSTPTTYTAPTAADHSIALRYV